ncbi:MAG: maltose alpha-D-glucosyltransferase [Magnetococcales bacterium]|nr:maltose alpha-D-glucosyltransferase [Magnetococcales bacterium]
MGQEIQDDIIIQKDSEWETDPLWYKDAIIYELHVKAFYDSSSNGYGDFRGLSKKLDYFLDLGVNTLWLLPFYPSPFKDDGYDISDYYNIHPNYGTLDDFRIFIREAHRRGLKIITELVINHTSDQHPWFQNARLAPVGSKERNFYVWSDTDKKFPDTRIIFSDTEKSNWTWDDQAQAYYWHRFFSHQPDLNHNNPEVVQAVIEIMRFWFDLGVDGLRLDAIPYLCVREGTNNENLPETHAVIKQMRAVIDTHYHNRMLLAEANQWPEDVREYFGDGDECHMAYNFPVMPRIFMSVALEERHPIVEIMQQTPEIPGNCQWAIFLRNHDELTLEMVTKSERDYMYHMYATDPRMRVNAGIRRRLAPLMDNSRDKIELVFFLLMTLPGSPIIYYGDEIGMGDNIYLGDRNGVRTPMQWTPDRNAGFSHADPQKLFLPSVMDPIYGYAAVNVEAQTRNTSSLLHWFKRLIIVRKKFKAFGRGSITFLESGNRKILSYIRQWNDEILLCVVNLARTAQPVELDLSHFKGRVPVEVMGRTAFPSIGQLPYLLTLKGYGIYGFRLATDVEAPYWHEQRLMRPELPVLVLTEGWLTLFGSRSEASNVSRAITTITRDRFQHQVLEPYLVSKRWFAAKGQHIDHITILEQGALTNAFGSWLLTFIEVHLANLPPQTYFLPLAICWEDDVSKEKWLALTSWTLARVRQKDRVGLLYGAFGDDRFCRAMVQYIGQNKNLPLSQGQIAFRATRMFDELSNGVDEPVHHPTLEQSNTAVFFGTRLFFKGYRRLFPGTNPEVEVGRFLTEISPFSNIVPVAGAVEYRRDDGQILTLGLLQAFVQNQGTGWNFAVDYLDRFLAEQLARPTSRMGEFDGNPHEYFTTLMTILGQRTAELHGAFSRSTGTPAFEPEPVTPEDLAAWSSQLQGEAITTLEALGHHLDILVGDERIAAERLLSLRSVLLERISLKALAGIRICKMRSHGDYHLGQVLLKENDFIITDFEGEPSRSIDQRMEKHSPLRDVAGMMRSISYVAAMASHRATDLKPADTDRLVALIQAWWQDATTAFLESYRKTIHGSSVVPEDPNHMDQLLQFFIIEKALYEIRYEMDNRPAWLPIPLMGLLRTLDHNC